jgi:EmrB/QacA subfamily drug resistance transporter
MSTNPKVESPWGLLVLLLVGTFMGTLGNSMVSIALPTLKDHFSVPLTSAVWTITLYTLTFSVLMPVFSVIGPAIGLKRMYIGGMICVCIGSLLSVLAPNFILFLFARVLTGIGVGTFLPSIMWVIANRFPQDYQGQATGYWALVNSLGHAVGPTLGGFFLQFLDWRGIFLINLPLGIISIIFALRMFPKISRTAILRFDTAGAAALATLTFCAMLAITMTVKKGILSSQALGLWLGAVACLIFIIFYERKRFNPFVDLTLFLNRKYFAAIMAISTQSFSQFGLLVSLPIFLIDINNVNQQIAGLLIMVMTLTMSFLSPISGKLSDKWGSKNITRFGIILIGLGAAYFSLVRMDTLAGWSWLLFVMGLVIFGFGFGFVQSAATVSVIQAVASDKTGAATGFFHMIRFINASLGSTVLGIILEMNHNGLLGGYYQGFIVILLLSIFALPFTFWMATRNHRLIAV